jgi:hypothetical protein
MSVKKILPRCMDMCRDGSRCGRRVKDGSNPPQCHLHKATAAGLPVSPLTQPAERTTFERLKRIAADDKHSGQLQALKILMEREEQAAPIEATWHTHLSPEETALLTKTIRTLSLLKARGNARATGTPSEHHGGPLPNCECGLCEALPTDPPLPERTTHEFRKHDQSTRPGAIVSDAPAHREPATSKSRGGERPPNEEVKPEDYDACGLFVLPESGQVTHAAGDDFAQRILSGEISLEDAKRMAADALRGRPTDSGVQI